MYSNVSFHLLLWKVVYFLHGSTLHLLCQGIYFLPWNLLPRGQPAGSSWTVCMKNRHGHLMGRNVLGQLVDSPWTARGQYNAGQRVDSPWTARGQLVGSL